MNDPKFGYHWIWLMPYYYLFQIYLSILRKWFPKRYNKAIGVKE